MIVPSLQIDGEAMRVSVAILLFVAALYLLYVFLNTDGED